MYSNVGKFVAKQKKLFWATKTSYMMHKNI